MVENSIVIVLLSIVGRLKSQRENMFPILVSDIIGEVVGLYPPSRSPSARLKAIRSSCKVSPPNIDPKNAPFGFKLLLKFLKASSRLFVQWRVRLLTIIQRLSDSKSHLSSSITFGSI